MGQERETWMDRGAEVDGRGERMLGDEGLTLSEASLLEERRKRGANPRG